MALANKLWYIWLEQLEKVQPSPVCPYPLVSPVAKPAEINTCFHASCCSAALNIIAKLF